MINDRMNVLPGMTGVSQIIGKYTLSDQERLEFEVNYVEFRIKSRQIISLYLNFLILLETFFLIFTGKGPGVVNRKIVSMLKINS
jgi:lipopolysaccharide/colanic/teichoic acid biosynthesis glycosyltransferase